MYFKVYRDVAQPKARKLVIELYSDSGALLDKTYMFAYLGLAMLRLRLKLRFRRMLKLQAIIEDVLS